MGPEIGWKDRDRGAVRLEGRKGRNRHTAECLIPYIGKGGAVVECRPEGTATLARTGGKAWPQARDWERRRDRSGTGGEPPRMGQPPPPVHRAGRPPLTSQRSSVSFSSRLRCPALAEEIVVVDGFQDAAREGLGGEKDPLHVDELRQLLVVAVGDHGGQRIAAQSCPRPGAGAAGDQRLGLSECPSGR